MKTKKSKYLGDHTIKINSADIQDKWDTVTITIITYKGEYFGGGVNIPSKEYNLLNLIIQRRGPKWAIEQYDASNVLELYEVVRQGLDTRFDEPYDM